MKKIIFALAFLLVSNTAFAAWTCTKPSDSKAFIVNDDGTATVNVSCTNGTDTLDLTRPIAIPDASMTNQQIVSYVKNSIRNMAAEQTSKAQLALRQQQIKNKLTNLKPNVDASTFTANETDPTV